jgi:hypothetical protein
MGCILRNREGIMTIPNSGAGTLPYEQRRGTKSVWQRITSDIESALKRKDSTAEAAALTALENYHKNTDTRAPQEVISERVAQDVFDAKRYLLMEDLALAWTRKNYRHETDILKHGIDILSQETSTLKEEADILKQLQILHQEKDPSLNDSSAMALAMVDRGELENRLMQDALNPPKGMTSDWAKRVMSTFIPITSSQQTSL